MKMLAFGLILFSFSASGQYANGWINNNQVYFKISIAKEGIYKLTYANLLAASFPVNSVDPRLIKLYHRGVEQAIFVQGEADAVFNATDFIEFFGRKNDGTLDKKLYQAPSAQPHNLYNLYSDTTAYFLTYSLIPPAGKRMAAFSEVNVSGIPKENFHTEERLLVLGNSYSGGEAQNSEISYTQFVRGEGWFGTALQQNQSIDYVLDLVTNSVPLAGLPQLEVFLVGRDNIAHSAEVLVGANVGALRSLTTANFFGFETPLLSVPLNWSDIGADGKITIRLKAGVDVTNRFQFSTAFLKITFPQSFNTSSAIEKKFFLQSNVTNKSYIELDNPSANTRLWDVTNPDDVLIIGTRSAGSALSAVVPNTSLVRKLFAASITSTPPIKPVSFRPINPTIPDFLIITHRALMKPALGYPNVVQSYAAYRASNAGGKYDTLTIAVDQLYDQFNYGETSSLAIYEFMRWMVDKGKPKYLFIIGKGRDIYSYSSYQRQLLPASEFRDLVPTAGYPASDMAFTAGLGGTSFEPKVATGRLSASNPTQVAAYLNKIIETESVSLAQEWRKQGLHLSGGIQPFELPLFRSYVDGFKEVATGKNWGANITTIGKRESNPSQLINVSDQVNKGTNLITFFGHSSPGTIDIDIGFVSDPVLGYNNPGKYPVFLINGCNAGAFFLNGTIFGEDWILAANKGARNFIAHSSFGFTNALRAYTDLFYRVGFADTTFIQKGIGDVQKEVASRYLTSFGSGISSVTQIQQMVLLGDPAVKLFGTAKPDYSLDNTSLSLKSIDGSPITSQSKSFGVRVVRRNIGATGSGNIPMRLIRTFGDNTSKSYDSVFQNVLNQDTVVFRVKRDAAGGGLNQFTVIIDPLNTIKEISKLNNSASFNGLISSDGTKNLFPAPYALVSKESLDLVFQATDLTSGVRDFRIEVDTTNRFNSPFLRSQVVSGEVLVRNRVNLLPADSTVYYWRTRFDKPKSNESTEWMNNSFTFIKNGPEGWGQLKFPQYNENQVFGLLKDAQLKKLNYLESVQPFSVTTFGSTNPTPPTSVSFKINNVEYNVASQGQPCRNNTINLVAFNKNTAVPYAGIPFNFQDPRTCGREPQLINSFLFSELETGLNDDLATYIDAIQQSDSVVLFSIGNPGYTAWSTTVKTKLGNFGISAAQINLLLDGEPVVILGRKGAAVGTARVLRSSGTPATAQSLSVSKTITGRFSNGSMKSTVIGPAKNWVRLVNQVTELQTTDVVRFTIYGVSLLGIETMLRDNVTGTLDLSFIDAKEYPLLRLEMKLEDEVNLSAAQLRKWLVLYETVAEGMLMRKGTIAQQTVQEGQTFTDQSFGFTNISDKQFAGQLTVRTDVLTKNSGKNQSSSFFIEAPKPGETTGISFSIDTKLKAGLNDVSVFVNPKILPEQYYDNNIVNLLDYLNVRPDLTAPILKVRIDGRVIQNKDFVSNQPNIEIELSDDNPFLLKKDTVGMTIFLKSECGSSSCPFAPIYFSRPDVTWSPATSTEPFKVKFAPQSLTEGLYTLRVEGTDASGNKSGVKPYEIDFRVSDNIVLVLKSVYPNPSTSSFYFSFVLSGNSLPDDFALQIYSLDGRLIQSFGRSQVEHFVIGTNEFSWTAIDNAGNAIPNGVYIYRMNVVVKGTSVTERGRLVLAR